MNRLPLILSKLSSVKLLDYISTVITTFIIINCIFSEEKQKKDEQLNEKPVSTFTLVSK